MSFRLSEKIFMNPSADGEINIFERVEESLANRDNKGIPPLRKNFDIKFYVCDKNLISKFLLRSE